MPATPPHAPDAAPPHPASAHPAPPHPASAHPAPLAPAQIARLSQLLDEALALPASAHAGWLAALPPADAPLRARLARALAAGSQPATVDALPALGEAPGGPGADGGDGHAGERIGPYRLRRELGRGGMGSVWLAERADGLFEREVALKLPRLARSPTLAARMAREQQIAARLEHPRIARLYDAGVDATGRPYLVMERVDGQPLADFAAQRGLGLAGRLRLVLQVCDALAHAHRLLVVHRDIKPSNLLVDAQGRVKLLDFGVARLLDDTAAGPSATLSDARTHTPLFAAPEQRSGGPVGTATDLYALALVAHELCTGRLPAAPGQPDASLPAPLRAVLARALAEAPAQRQASVAHFADELRDVLAHRVPPSWAAPPLARLRLALRRHRLATSWAALAGAGALAAALLLLQAQARTQAEQARVAQVRLFLTTTLADTEPRAGQGADAVTGLQIVEGAIARARRAFADQPVLRAEVLAELAVLLRRFGRGAEALPLLHEAEGLMRAHAAPDDPGRALVAAQLALQLQQQAQATGDAAARRDAGAQAQAALQACAAGRVAATERCARARAQAQAALRNLAVERGDDAEAQRAATAAAAEAERAWGPAHAETAMAQLQAALVLRNGDRLAEADAAVQAAARAASTAEATTGWALRRADAGELRLVQALLALDLGRHAEALQRLDALAREIAPASPDHALLQRLRAQALWQQGRLEAAVEAATAALAQADRHGDGWERRAALAARAQALAALGPLRDAVADATRLATLQQAATAPGAPATAAAALRLARLQAELALRAGRADEALARVQPLTQGAFDTAPVGLLDRALAWQLRGRAEQALGRHDAARDSHAQAAQRLAGVLPPEHPARLRSAVHLALAHAALGAATPGGPPPDPATRSALLDAVARYRATLPPDSRWQAALDLALQPGHAAAVALP